MTIAYLMALTVGIAMSITAMRAVEWIRFPADHWYYRQDSIADIDGRGWLVAFIYGMCLTTFLYAYRSGQIWQSPGKILAMLFAAMCVLDLGLSAVAGAIVSYRVNHDPGDLGFTRGVSDQRGFVLGIWYSSFSARIGYSLSLPLILLTIWKTTAQSVAWRLVWVAFLIFNLIVVADLYFQIGTQLPITVAGWSFELAISVPLGMIAVAMLVSLFREHHVDWWTAIIATPLLIAWVIAMTVKLGTM